MSKKEHLGLYIVTNNEHSSYGQLLSMAGLSTLQNWQLVQDILAILMYKVKNTCAPHTLALYLNSLQLSINFAIMTSLYPDLTQSPLESTCLGIWAQRYGSSVPSNVTKTSILSSFKYNIRKVDLSILLGDNNCSNCSLCSS